MVIGHKETLIQNQYIIQQMHFYNTHDIHSLLRVSAPTCHLQGIITTRASLPTYNIYAVQQDTQSVLMSEFYSALMLARHVSDLIGPSSGAFFYKLYSQI